MLKKEMLESLDGFFLVHLVNVYEATH